MPGHWSCHQLLVRMVIGKMCIMLIMYKRKCHLHIHMVFGKDQINNFYWRFTSWICKVSKTYVRTIKMQQTDIRRNCGMISWSCHWPIIGLEIMIHLKRKKWMNHPVKYTSMKITVKEAVGHLQLPGSSNDVLSLHLGFGRWVGDVKDYNNRMKAGLTDHGRYRETSGWHQ